MPMVSAPFLVALLALCVSLAAILQLMSSVDHQLGAMTLFEAAQDLMPLVAMGGLHAAMASIYCRLYRGAAAGVAAGTEVAAAILCAVVGLLVKIFVCDPAVEGDDDGGARAWEEELGMAAAHVLPAAAMAAFFLGVGLLFMHLRAGGGEVAREGFVQILVKIVLGAIAVLVGLMALAQAQ